MHVKLSPAFIFFIGFNFDVTDLHEVTIIAKPILPWENNCESFWNAMTATRPDSRGG